MKIYPEDLGTELEADVLRDRATRGRLSGGTALPKPLRLLSVAFRWAQRAEAGQAGPAPDAVREPLSLPEVRDQQGTDPLQRQYLGLVCSIVSSPAQPDADSEREVRAALQALGNTVQALPMEDAKIVTDDPAVLQKSAAGLRAEAQAEPDPVITASLCRRAESLTHRSETVHRMLLLLRRNQALRQETAEQMEALQTSVIAFRVGGRRSAPGLADLAASIQRVAQEANSITMARDEVGVLVEEPYQAAPAERTGQTAAVQA